MTDEQRDTIRNMRADGDGYAKIAGTLGISENTVRSFCRRDAAPKETDTSEHICPCCGATVAQTPGRKEKKFCSDSCRMKWWNAHPEKVNRRTGREAVCRHCGRAFTAYGARKYCCHACYVAERFGNE